LCVVELFSFLLVFFDIVGMCFLVLVCIDDVLLSFYLFDGDYLCGLVEEVWG